MEFNCPPPCNHGYIINCDKCKVEQLELEISQLREVINEATEQLAIAAFENIQLQARVNDLKN